MAEPKTKKNRASVKTFLDAVEDPQKRADSFAVLEIMKKATGEKPAMWGDSIVGFGSYHYVYASGREGDWMLTGFSPRKREITLYIMAGFDRYETLLSKLGKYRTGKSCLYIKTLTDVDATVLEKLVKASAEHVAKHQGCGS